MKNNALLLIVLLSLTHCKMFKKDSKLESQTITSINNRFDDPLKQKETNIYMDQYPGGKKSDYYPYMCFYTSQAPLWWKNPEGKLEPAPYEMRNMAHLQSFKRFSPQKMPQIAPYVPIFELSKRMAAMADESTRDAKRAELAQQQLQMWQGFVSRITANAFATIAFMSSQGMRLLSMQEAEKMNILRLADLEKQAINAKIQGNELFIRQQQTIAQKAQMNVDTLFKTGAVYLSTVSKTKNVGVNVFVASTSNSTTVTKQELRGNDEGVMGALKDSLTVAAPGMGSDIAGSLIKPPSNNVEALHESLRQAKNATENVINLMEQMKAPISQLHDVAQNTHSLIVNADGQILGGATQLVLSLTAPHLLMGAKVATFAASAVSDLVLSKKIGKKMTEKTNSLLQREYVDIFSKAFNATQSQQQESNNKPVKIEAYDVETLPILDQAVMAMAGAGSIDTTLSCPPRRLDPSTYQLIPIK